MKKVVLYVSLVAAAIIAVSCGTAKQASSAAPGEVSKAQTVEGESVNQAPWNQFGYENGEGVNKKGEIIQVPYVYFSGNGTSANLRIAEEMARSAAYALISDSFSIKNINEKTSEAQNGITDSLEEEETKKIAMASEEFNRYVSQQSANTLKGFTPFGKTVIQFNEDKQLYTVWARVGMPSKAWVKLYENLLNYKPKDLTNKELDTFSKIQGEVLGSIFQFDDDE